VRASEEPFKRRARRSVGSPARPRSPAARLALDRGCPPGTPTLRDFKLKFNLDVHIQLELEHDGRTR
jgi:hypothetical protein